MKNQFYQYNKDGVSFSSKEAAKYRSIYFPLCGVDTRSIKSAITPSLSGDIKIDKHRYLTKPVSTEDLRNELRNFYVVIDGQVFSLAQGDPTSTHVEMGPLWHKVKRTHKSIELSSLNFVPVQDGNVEIMQVTVKNISDKTITMTPTAAIPLFARALSNKHDHEHVTSLLHRTERMEEGVVVAPTMIFDERGHLSNETLYFVIGCDEKGKIPIGSFPTQESFYGEAASNAIPQAVEQNLSPGDLNGHVLDGKEAMGALRFADETLEAGKSKSYCIIMGIGEQKKDIQQVCKRYNSNDKVVKALEENKQHWSEKSRSIQFNTSDQNFNAWLRWVSVQPVLRRIFGCSFLPDHDYGKGGRGWRDLWQDLLSLILIEPDNVRETLISNFAGIRIDGSNATIIGAHPGEFIADRNAISRVWMDYGVWPLLTLALYMDQTGDFDILFEKNSYFRDPQLCRKFMRDKDWTPEYGQKLKDQHGKVYEGTILEHILVQHLVQFFNVGEHNNMRLENADWNDGLDMAFERGESVAFTSLYGGNYFALADILEFLKEKKNVKSVKLFKELGFLLDTCSDKSVNYDKAEEKKDHLYKTFCDAVEPEVSGELVDVSLEDVIQDLRRKGNWIFDHLRKNELMTVKAKQTYRWFNGYYDNKGKRVEGKNGDRVMMTLTGQVFPLMAGVADEKETKDVVEAVEAFLHDEKHGGYRLNTDFGVKNYLDLGRAFGFAYGTKENGAVFCHMMVMYAFALYKQGLSRKGYEVIQELYEMCMNTDRSKIYPGVPEYFDPEGRGRYHYLTGSASWLILLELTQAFGVRGEQGDLVLSPQLVKEQFDQDGRASVRCQFAGKTMDIEYINPSKKDVGEYTIQEVHLNGKLLDVESLKGCSVKVLRSVLNDVSDTLLITCSLS